MDYKERVMNEGDIRCHNTEKADIRFQDGALRHVLGACHYQVTRACRDKELSPEGRGWTYNHAPMLVYWNEHFLIEYLSGPASEHESPSAAFLCVSQDGKSWRRPEMVFPPITVPAKNYRGPGIELVKGEKIDCIVHHRMGFYVTSDNRLLVLTFYGISPTNSIAPNNGYGVGRVVREIKPDFTFGNIYFLRYNEPGGFNRKNSDNYPYYRESGDTGFIKACEELLSQRLVTLQWWEEERLDDSFFTLTGAKALSYYTLPNGDTMAVSKNACTSISRDRGESWNGLKKSYSLETSTGKVWGQKTTDGKYALVYNPSTDSAHRWPLAVVTGDNGVDFDNLLAVTPEVSPCRYQGKLKNLGPQYMRGICECNPQNTDMAMWLTYSVNKEDIWISRIPVPVSGTETKDISEYFYSGDGIPDAWNLYIPAWSSVKVCETPSGKERSLYLSDWDPYNRVCAERAFIPAEVVRIETKIMVEQLFSPDAFTLELQDRHGACPVKLIIRQDNVLYARIAGLDKKVCSIVKGEWLELTVTADCVKNEAAIKAEQAGNTYETKINFAQSVHRLERIVYRTKESLPFQNLEINGRNGDIGDLPDADQKHRPSVFYIHHLKVKALEL